MSIDTVAELRERVEFWRRHGNGGTGLMVNIDVLEGLLRRPDLTPEQCAEIHDELHVRWEYSGQVPGFTKAQRNVLAALRAASDREAMEQ